MGYCEYCYLFLPMTITNIHIDLDALLLLKIGYRYLVNINSNIQTEAMDILDEWGQPLSLNKIIIEPSPPRSTCDHRSESLVYIREDKRHGERYFAYREMVSYPMRYCKWF
jgi:hypothetical protein